METLTTDFIERIWERSWTYIKTVVDVVREPILILDKEFRVIAANDPFYKTFKVEAKNTQGKIVYELGNGQWNIPDLKKLLEDILPKHTFFKGFEVIHEFPVIGRKIMILNARQIHLQKKDALEMFPPIILLAIEDVTQMMIAAENFANHTKQLETKFTTQIAQQEIRIKKLEKEINEIKKI